MKINAEKLIEHIERARVGGLINEAVLDEHLSFSVTDDSKVVLSISNMGLGTSGFGPIGVFDLGKFVKTIQFAAKWLVSPKEDLELQVEGNCLVFRKRPNEFKFLLSNVGAIGSSVINVDDVMARVRKGKAIEVQVAKIDFDMIDTAIDLVAPERLTVRVKDEKVSILVGIKTQHSSVISLGEVKSKESFELSLHPTVFAKLIKVLPYDEGITMEIRKGLPVVFASDSYTFLISPMRAD
jgi:hypothetical protein